MVACLTLGLLGTIAGYLLDKESRERPPAPPPPDAAKMAGST